MSNDQPSELHSLRTIAHPLRLRILSLLTGAAMSAAEAARALGDTQANVSYHLRRLHETGLLEIVEEVTIRGGRAKRYRHNPDSGTHLTRTHDDHQVLAAVLADELRRRTARRRHGTRGSMTDAEVWVDPKAWQAALHHVRAAGELLHAAAKPPHTPGTVRVSATISLFQMDTRG